MARALKQMRSRACLPISIWIRNRHRLRRSSLFCWSTQAASRRSGRASHGKRLQLASFYIGCACLRSVPGIIGTSRSELTQQAERFNSSLHSLPKAALRKASFGRPQRLHHLHSDTEQDVHSPRPQALRTVMPRREKVEIHPSGFELWLRAKARYDQATGRCRPLMISTGVISCAFHQVIMPVYGKVGLASAPRLPETLQTNCGSISDCRR